MIASFIHGARVKLVDIIYNNYIILKQTGQKMELLKNKEKSHRKSPVTGNQEPLMLTLIE